MYNFFLVSAGGFIKNKSRDGIFGTEEADSGTIAGIAIAIVTIIVLSVSLVGLLIFFFFTFFVFFFTPKRNQ